MRLYKYLSISSSDDEANSFRSFNIDLVESDTGNIDLVKRVSEKYKLNDDVLILLEKSNKELKKIYKGKLRFDFCLEDQGMTPDEVKMGIKKIRQLKEKWFQLNDEMSNIQICFEKTMRKSLQK